MVTCGWKTLTLLAGLLLGVAVTATHVQAAIEVGDYIYFHDGAGTTGGGEFGVEKLANPSAAYGASPTLFYSFCIQTNEYLNFSGKFYVAGISTYATLEPEYANGQDPIDPKTAYLYTNFSKGTLSNYNYANAAGRVASANSLQRALWFLEGELTSNALMNSYLNDAQAVAWVAAAGNANWSDVGNVRVMNLRFNGPTGTNAQDQLFMIPERDEVVVAEPTSIAVWSLLGAAAFGFVKLRRRNGARAT